jgi:DNA helicase HerA-like ATPase
MANSRHPLLSYLNSSGPPGPMDAAEAVRLVPHRRFDQPQLITVTGKRGSGKTWFLQQWLERQEPRVLVLDPFDKDFAGIRRRENYEDALDEFRATADRENLSTDAGNYAPLRRRVVPDWGYLDPTAKFRGNARDYADKFMESVVEHAPPGAPPLNLRLVLDELSLYVGRQIRGTAFETLVLQGRRMGVSLVVATQRTMRIPVEMRSEVTDFIAFNATLQSDLEVYEEFGVPDAYSQAPHLHRGECFYVPTGM